MHAKQKRCSTGILAIVLSLPWRRAVTLRRSSRSKPLSEPASQSTLLSRRAAVHALEFEPNFRWFVPTSGRAVLPRVDVVVFTLVESSPGKTPVMRGSEDRTGQAPKTLERENTSANLNRARQTRPKQYLHTRHSLLKRMVLTYTSRTRRRRRKRRSENQRTS